MKALTIDVPPEGASVQLILRGGGSPAQAVIVAADNVEIRYAEVALAPAAAAAKPGEKRFDLDAISQSLFKLHTKTRAGAVDVIKTMFQFTDPISTETANRILDHLRKRGDLSVTPDGEMLFVSQKESVPMK